MSFFELIRNGKVLEIEGMIDEDAVKPNPQVDLNGGMSIAAQARHQGLVELMYQTLKERQRQAREFNAANPTEPPKPIPVIRSLNWSLDSAAQAGSLQIVQWILKTAKLERVRLEVDLPMRAAARGGHLELVRLFRELPDGPDIKCAWNFNGAVVQAQWFGHLSVVMYLLLDGATDWKPALRLLTDPEHLHQLHERWPDRFAAHGLTLPCRLPQSKPSKSRTASARPSSALVTGFFTKAGASASAGSGSPPASSTLSASSIPLA